MVSNRKLDDLFDDAELPFGHPGRNFDETPAELDQSDDRYEPPPVDPPDEGIVHYGPGNQPLCGSESHLAVHTDNPAQVRGCQDCMDLVQEDLNDKDNHAGRCLNCNQTITARGGVAWRRIVRNPCPYCGTAGW